MRVRIDLAYDGTDFSGWATQPGLRTIQATVESALATLVRHPVTLTVAGRTDAGVHASGQVCSADLAAVPDLRRLNVLLPDDVVALAAVPVSDAFDARFAATGRSYRYRVTDAIPDPLRRRNTLAWPRPLVLDRMQAAAAQLLGEHDFAAFCRRREGASTVRALHTLELRRDGGVITIDLAADAFCHSMVRAIVGALLVVGDGRREPELVGQVLTAGVRDGRFPVVAAHGLTLTGVAYPATEEELVARQRASRRLRTLVRSATQEDLPQVLDLYDEVAAWLEARGREGQWGSGPVSAHPEAVAGFTARIAAGELQVAVDAGRVVGVLAVTGEPDYLPPAPEPAAFVALLATSRAHAPRGLGRELIERAAERAAADGSSLLRLDCWRSEDRALIAVYERMGFRVVDEVVLQGRPGALLERRLSRP